MSQISKNNLNARKSSSIKLAKNSYLFYIYIYINQNKSFSHFFQFSTRTQKNSLYFAFSPLSSSKIYYCSSSFQRHNDTTITKCPLKHYYFYQSNQVLTKKRQKKRENGVLIAKSLTEFRTNYLT